MQPVIDWVRAKLGDTDQMMMLASLLVIFALLILMGDILAPLIVAIVLAYVMDGVVELLEGFQLPRLLSISIVGLGALCMMLFLLLGVIPLLTEQVGRLIMQVPEHVTNLRTFLHALQENYAGWIKPEYVQQLIVAAAGKLQGWGGELFSFSLASIPGLITLMIYVVLVPVLVFFMLKDKLQLIAWAQDFLPKERTLLNQVGNEVDVQIGNYIRGKVWETLIVGAATWLGLWMFGHEYALLLGALTGISVWIPFVGIALVAVPVVLLSLFQWGWSDVTAYALITYAVIQILDANVLVPWIFSEVVNLHPIAIIVAILIFGSLWGLVGVFVAIPMAALVQSVLKILMRSDKAQAET